MPKISVLLPVYKTNETHLREAIASILAQTYRDFELLILDDCPEDPREAIVSSFDDKRIKYFKNKTNLGISNARNTLIDLATGEYLAVMDHDDISLPNRFEEEVEFLDAHPDYGVVSCAFQTLPGAHISTPPMVDHEIKVTLCTACAILHPASMIRKSVLIDNNIRYEEEFSPSEDHALWCRLSKFTRFYNIQDVLFTYRNHEGNTTHNQGKKMFNALASIRAIMATENPALYREFLFKATHTTRIRSQIRSIENTKIFSTRIDCVYTIYWNLKKAYTLSKISRGYFLFKTANFIILHLSIIIHEIKPNSRQKM